MAKQVECPECGAAVELDDDVITGEIIECPDCAVELEVTGVDPLQVELAPEEDEGVGTFFDYMVGNTPGFAETAGTGKAFGWAGPYLSDAPGADPWGRRYACNVGVLGRDGKWLPILLSAGPDGVVSCPFQFRLDKRTAVFGDDIYVVLR